MRLFFTLFVLLSLNHFAFAGSNPRLAAVVGNNDKSYSSVSPNPAREVTTLRFYNPSEDEHRIEIYDIIGNFVTTIPHVEKAKQDIDVSDFKAGVYFYFIFKGNERVSTGRIIVRH